jgi:hypothetical protein
MASIVWISEAELSDGRGGVKTVRSGDRVRLIPEPEDDGTEAATKAREKWRRAAAYLGGNAGRKLRVESIGRWDCGRVELYFTNGKGLHAAELVAAS